MLTTLLGIAIALSASAGAGVETKGTEHMGFGEAAHAALIFERFEGIWSCSITPGKVGKELQKMEPEAIPSRQTVVVERTGPINFSINVTLDGAKDNQVEVWTAAGPLLLRTASGGGQFLLWNGAASFDGSGELNWTPAKLPGISDWPSPYATTYQLKGKNELKIVHWGAQNVGNIETIVYVSQCVRGNAK